MRRLANPSPEFWRELEAALPSRGDPAWHDFAGQDLPGIIREFEERWDQLSVMPSGRRVVIGAGRVAAYAVEGELRRDGSIELVKLAVDVRPPWLTGPEN